MSSIVLFLLLALTGLLMSLRGCRRRCRRRLLWLAPGLLLALFGGFGIFTALL